MIQHLLSLASRRRTDDGASAVEYGLLVALIAALIVGVVFALGTTIQGAFTDTNEDIQNPGGAPAAPPE